MAKPVLLSGLCLIIRTDRFNDKQDVVIRGLTIPKGFSVLVPVYAIHHDPEVWDSPEEFRPERYMNIHEMWGIVP